MTIKLMRGRYGPYVTDGSTNATVRDQDPLSVTLEQAITLIAERAAKGGPRKKNGKSAKPRRAKAETTEITKKATSTEKKKTAKKKTKTAPSAED